MGRIFKEVYREETLRYVGVGNKKIMESSKSFYVILDTQSSHFDRTLILCLFVCLFDHALCPVAHSGT